MQKSLKLIALYLHICESYEAELQWEVQRFSPNGQEGQITDQELITICLFCTMYEQKLTQKAMYEHIVDYWASWFPTLPSYKNFNTRLIDYPMPYNFWSHYQWNFLNLTLIKYLFP